MPVRPGRVVCLNKATLARQAEPEQQNSGENAQLRIPVELTSRFGLVTESPRMPSTLKKVHVEELALVGPLQGVGRAT